jgi:hypothetical protein
LEEVSKIGKVTVAPFSLLRVVMMKKAAVVVDRVAKVVIAATALLPLLPLVMLLLFLLLWLFIGLWLFPYL